MLKFKVKNRKTQNEQSYHLKQSPILIGRSPKNDVSLSSASVSRQHAQLVIDHNQVFLEDLNSGNGTILNQERLAPHKRQPLKKGDLIRIEEYDIEVDFSSLNAEAKQEINKDLISATEKMAGKSIDQTDPDILEVKMIKKILGAFESDKRPCLFVISEPYDHLKIHVDDTGKETTIGRDQGCNFTIDDNMISRVHARIIKKWGDYVVIDASSRNKTFVNGEEVSEKIIHDGDEITFGNIKAIFRNPNEFDIAAISHSIESEEATKVGSATEEEPKQNQASNLAKLSLGETQEFEKDDVETPEADSQNERADEAEANDQETEDEAKSEPDPEPSESQELKTKPKKKKSAIGALEIILFVFAFAILGLIIWAFSILLN